MQAGRRLPTSTPRPLGGRCAQRGRCAVRRLRAARAYGVHRVVGEQLDALRELVQIEPVLVLPRLQPLERLADRLELLGKLVEHLAGILERVARLERRERRQLEAGAALQDGFAQRLGPLEERVHLFVGRCQRVVDDLLQERLEHVAPFFDELSRETVHHLLLGQRRDDHTRKELEEGISQLNKVGEAVAHRGRGPGAPAAAAAVRRMFGRSEPLALRLVDGDEHDGLVAPRAPTTGAGH
jgi:hypothetical protein